MTKTKIILIAVALSLVFMVAVGVTLAKYVNTQNQTTAYSQTSQGYTGNSGYMSPNNGYGFSSVTQQGAYPTEQAWEWELWDASGKKIQATPKFFSILFNLR